MAKKRITTMDDADRLAENVFNFDPTIRDQASFNLAYDNYLSDGGEDAKQNKRLRNMTFDAIRKNNPRITKENIIKKAGGKDLKRDRQTTAQTVVKTRKEYIKQGARNVDLKNYDTVARRKQSIVFSRKDSITRKGKKVNVLRDSKGRFVKRTEK